MFWCLSRRVLARVTRDVIRLRRVLVLESQSACSSHSSCYPLERVLVLESQSACSGHRRCYPLEESWKLARLCRSLKVWSFCVPDCHRWREFYSQLKL